MVSSSPSDFKYITDDGHGNAIITGTKMKVRELIAEHLFYGWQPLELAQNHENLSLKQVYAALAFYHDRRDEIDLQIKQDLQYVAQAKLGAGASLLQRKLSQ